MSNSDRIERVVPGITNDYLYQEHVARYIFASRFVSEGKRVLDVACGSGYGTEVLAQVSQKTIGIDISKQALDFAVVKYSRPSLFVEGNAIELPIADNTIDTIVSFETIEHLQNPEAFVQELHRLLTDDGILIISTPNKLVYSLLLEKNPFHLREFHRWEFQRLLKTFFMDVRLYSNPG